MYIFLLVLGRGQDKPAWTACPPGVKITRVEGKLSRDSLPRGGKLSRGKDKLGHRQISTLPHYPRRCGQKVTIKLFQNMVILHIKLKEIIKCSNMVANVVPTEPPYPTTLGDEVKWSNFKFF